MSILALLVLALICVTRCRSLYQTTMSAFESSSNVIPYNLQGQLAAGIEHTTVFEIVQNIRVLSWPYDIYYPAARLNNLCKSTPNFLKLEGKVPEMIKYPNILHSELSNKQYKSNSLPNIGKNNGLMTDFESPPKKNPYYLQGSSVAGIAPTKPRETNPNASRFSIPGSFYPEARSKVVCELTPNIFGLEGLVPEVIKYPNILPSGLSSKQHKSNSLPGKVTNEKLMPAFESSPSTNPYYLQGPLAAGIAPTTPSETNPNADGLSIPYGSSYPEAGTNVVCESTPNILDLEGLEPEVIKHPNIFPLGLSSKQYKPNSLPGIDTNKGLMPVIESSPSENPYYLQGPSAASIAATKHRETNPNADRFSILGSSYPEARSNVVCEFTPNILGLEGLVPEVIEHHNIFPSGLYSKQYKPNSLPGMDTNNGLMPAIESSPSENPYYLQGTSAASIAATKPREANPNADRFSIPGSSYPEARSNVVCEFTPNILGLEGLVPEDIKYPNICPSALSSKQHKSNSLPGVVTNDKLMPAFESSPSKNPYYLQGLLAAGIAPTTPSETNPNADGLSIPYGSSYPEAGTNVVCESTPYILDLEGLEPEVIKHPNIFPLGLSSEQNKPNLLPGIITRKALMPDFESSPNKNPYYLQVPSAANIKPTTVLETNPNVDGFSMPYCLLYPEAGSKVVCESPPNIFGREGLVPEVIEHHNRFPSGLSSKQYKLNSLPGRVTNDELMPALESSPSKNPYYLQGPSAAGKAPTKARETNPNANRFSISGSFSPEARSNVVCKFTPNIFGLEGLVPEVIKYPNILPSGLSSKQHKSNSLPGIVTNEKLMPAFGSSPSKNPYYLQGPSAAGIAPTTPSETNPNADGFSIPYGSPYPEAGKNVVCEAAPNILGLERLVPEVIEYHDIFPTGLSSKQYKSNSLPGIVTNEELMPAFESSPSKNPYYLQGSSAAGIAPTTPSETNLNADRFSIPGSSYPEAGSNVVCESTSNILGLEGLVPEVIKHPNIFPSGLSFKQNKSNLLPGIITRKSFMPAFESSPNKYPYYLQGISAANITPTTVLETNPNVDGFSTPYGLLYPEARSNFVCKPPLNIFGFEGQVPETIKYLIILPSGLFSKHNKSKTLPGSVTNNELMPAFESSPSKNLYYLQGLSAAGIAPTTPRETNPNADGFSIPYGPSYPDAGSNVVCESTPNILGLEGLVPEVIKHPNILLSGLYSKQYKSILWPGTVTNNELMPAYESSPSYNPHY